jgi:integrase
MENHSIHTVKASTYQFKMTVINKHILPELGNIKLVDLKPLTIQKFYSKKLKAGYSASYIKSIHAVISKILKAAAEWEYIPKNIAPLIKAPRIPTRNVTVWSMEEANQFINFVQGRRFFIAYILAIYTGMRKGEILGLKWKNCDLENARLCVSQTLSKVKEGLVFQEPKTKGSKRTISLPSFAVQCLKKHKALQNELKLKFGNTYEDNALVIASGLGRPIDPADNNRDMKYVIKKNNLPPISFHDLRHTHATTLLLLGENPKVVSERLGHANVGITLDTYSHVLPDMQKDLAKNFDQAMKKLESKREGFKSV